MLGIQMVDGDPLDMSRRGFMLAGTTSLMAMDGVGQLQLSGSEPVDEYEFQGVADLMGPADAKPVPGSEFFDNKVFWAYRYETTDESPNARYFITQDDSAWTELMSIPTDQLDNVETQQSISFFNHTFARPEAPDTKNWDFTPADVTKDASEVELASTTVLETTQRGNYPPGGEATPGVALRLTGTPTAGEAFGGYANTTDGLIVGEDTTDSFVEIRNGGAAKKVRRPNWNGYVPDERVWVDSRPIITRMPHLFYGGGDLGIDALLHGEDGSELRRLHTFTADSVNDAFGDGATISQPNLPVRFESDGLTGGNLRANACHYQFELSQGETRVNGEHFINVDAGTTGWTPLIAWSKRTNWDMVNVKPLKIKVAAASADAKVELQLGATVSGGTWDLPTHSSSSETSVEVNTGASLDGNGERRWPGFVPAGQGSKTGTLEADDLTFNLSADRTVVLAAQGVGGTSTLSGVVGWEEYF